MKTSASIQKIKRITERIISLPTLPTVVSKLIQLVDNPKTSASSLANLIYKDQALTARILKLANSAYYGFPREISTVNMAIVVLGFNTVKEMTLSLSVFEAFKDAKNDSAFDISRFWQHSIGCGSAARMLSRRFAHQLTGEAFVAGLLHDIGKIILRQYMPQEFSSIMEMVASGKTNLDEAETDIVGATHSQIGAWLAEKWNLPRIIVGSIANHHAPWNAQKDQVFVAMISVANYLCHLSHIGNSGRPNPQKPDQRTWDIFRSADLAFDESDLEGLQMEFLLEFDKTDLAFSFMNDEDPVS
jgi:putative nucleotidyltransferase with HDIG domain